MSEVITGIGPKTEAESQAKFSQRGFSLVELLIVASIILILVAMAMPSWLHARMNGDEGSAVGSMRAINFACQEYASTYGAGFPPSLASLGPAANPSSSAADLLDIILSAGNKSGYVFTYVPGAPVGGVINSYTVTANPAGWGSTGQEGFFTDQSYVIRVNPSGVASVNDSPVS
jgi:prepilin-type N-terminal cleavage/methylation domain-containing protein